MKKTTPWYIKYVAKEMRKELTPAEAMLWERLRRKGLLGLKFYRQYPINRFVADFCCPEKKLILELDGGIHETKSHKVYDEIRDKTLGYASMRVLRFKNEQVLSDIEGVLKQIENEITSNFPLPQDGGGDGERVE